MSKVIKLINMLMVMLSIFIACNIFLNKETSFLFLNSLYSTMSNHININKQDQLVSSTNNYIKISQYKYTNENHRVYCPFNGTVVFKSDNNLIIKCENGYYAYYSALVNIGVNKYDVISSNDALANFVNEFIFYFMKDEIIYSYEEIIEIN